MVTQLIITEKPASAKKLAEALSSKPKREVLKKVSYYVFEKNNKKVIIGSAVGHLFSLSEKNKTKNFEYPVFDIEWMPSYSVNKSSAFSKPYVDALKKISKNVDEVVIACDYDVEGEVIGLNVVRFICNRNDAMRMKFSTLTKEDLVKSYDSLSKSLDWGQAEAGETRHFLDFFYGINISRALTKAIRKSGRFKILSTGRVQGPALKIIVDREKEIQAFKPVPFWEIELNVLKDKTIVSAWHVDDKFWDKSKADEIFNKVKNEKKALVKSVEKNEFKQSPPIPFDLTSLQTEAYRCFGTKPKKTLELAQDLYTGSFISYPRTSSQQLPEALGFSSILKELSKNASYSKLCSQLLSKKSLVPNNGKKSDPAHPAIYPTGVVPKGMDDDALKIYDLVVKRFLATFAEPAVRETVKVVFDVKSELFVAKGTRTIEKGWHVFYDPYVVLEEEELPKFAQNSQESIKKLELHAKETQPPKRYTPSSIVRELEKRNLGTKATRAEIVDTLYKRNYIKGEKITATELGIHIIGVLEKYCGKIVDEELTKHFELDMEDIREKKKRKDVVLKEAKSILIEILDEFKNKEDDIGKGLLETFKETAANLVTVGSCPNCGSGSLIIRKGKFGRFVACDKYPDCKTTFSLPSSGMVEVTSNICVHCKHPLVKMIRKSRQPQEVCINSNCPSKAVPSDVKEKPCPKCKDGKLLLRKSIYGSFLGCSNYPKCRTIEKFS